MKTLPKLGRLLSFAKRIQTLLDRRFIFFNVVNGFAKTFFAPSRGAFAPVPCRPVRSA